jgi:transcriptional regulator with XRE-family HTH domain
MEQTVLSEIKRQKKTVTEVAGRLGITRVTFYNYIKSAHPDPNFVRRLETELNISLTDVKPAQSKQFSKQTVVTGRQLKKALKDKGISDEQAAKELNITVEALQALYTKTDIGTDVLSLIKENFGIDIKGIELTSSKAHDTHESERMGIVVNMTPTLSTGQKMTPVYELPVMGSAVEVYNDEPEVSPKYHVFAPQFSDCEFGRVVRGESMLPIYRPGGVVFLKKVTAKYISYGEVYWIEFDGYSTIKRLLKGDSEDTIIADSDNTATAPSGRRQYDSFTVAKHDIRRIYLVKGYMDQVQS